MIGYLKGKVIDSSNLTIIIDVNGVGYLVNCNSAEFLVGTLVELFVFTYVREDQISLFGFKTKSELTLFKLLTTVKGVGPKVALSILSNLGQEELIQSILTADAKSLCAVPGIGKKVGERLILELKSKIENLGFVVTGKKSSNKNLKNNNVFEEASEALQSLGYSKKESEEKISKIDIDDENCSVEEIIKKCFSK